MCEKRNKFATKEQAQRGAAAIAQRVRLPVMVPYWCETCERWCLTSKRRTVDDLFDVVEDSAQ